MMAMRRALSVPCLLILSLFFFAGCKPDLPYQYGGSELKDPARRIVSMAPGITEVLAEKGGGANCLVGRTSACNYPKFVTHIPVVANPKPDWERIAQARADLIVYDPGLYNASDVQQFAKYSRMPPFALGGDTVKEFCDNLLRVSTLYTGETFMSSYVDDITEAIQKAQADPVKPTPTVAVIMPDPSGQDYIAGKNSFYADEVRCATGNPVGPDGNKFVPLNPENLIQMNPDIIVTSGDPSDFAKDSRFQSLKAIKSKHLLPILPDALLRRGARVPDVIEAMHNKFSGFTQ